MKEEFEKHQLYPLPAVLVGAMVNKKPNMQFIWACVIASGSYE